MREYELEVLEQYDIEVNGTRKIRGAILCDTKEGNFLLQETRLSEKRVPLLCGLYEHIEAAGYPNVDKPVANREGSYLSAGENGQKYILKKWYNGRECDVRKNYEVLDATRNLAKLHLTMVCHLDWETCEGADGRKENLEEEYKRHNQELKKVRTFMRRRTQKGEFETAFLKQFDSMYQWAENTSLRMKEFGYEELYEKSKARGEIIHGDYNYHNVLMSSAGMITTNFEHFRQDIQVSDLYYFLRKAMEKHGWEERLGDGMLEEYSKIHSLTEGELTYIALCLSYPEKFWKVANTYYRSNKAWIPVKCMEKLTIAAEQTEEKKRFLQNIFAFHL